MKNTIFFLLFSLLCVTPTLLWGQLSVSKTDASGCGKQDGSISASIPVADVEYALNGAGYQTSGHFNDLGAGTYTVTARKKGGSGSCMAMESVEIEDGSMINASVSGGGSFQFCEQDGPPEISLFCSASGGVPPLTFSWPDGRLDNAGSGTQTCTVTDKNGCRDDASVTVVSIPIRCSRDPNDITGPAGYGLQHWVSVNDRLPYLIRFENDPDFATAPAVKVVVEYVLDEDLNLFSIRLGDFGFANIIFNVPANSTFYSNRLDVRDSLGVFVDVTAGIDVTANKVFWIFEAIDPATGLVVTDPDLGMLPVNDTLTHRGEGFVNFSVKPKNSAVTGDSILAQAAIVFDINETILTNEFFNLVDAFPPTSHMVSNLPSTLDTTSFQLSWTASDDPGGSGVRDFTLFVSVNNGPFQVYRSNIPDTFLVFQGVAGAKYAFFTVAVDHVGNMEASKPNSEIVVALTGQPALRITGFDKNSYCLGDSIQTSWVSREVEGVEILISASGIHGPFQMVQRGIEAVDGKHVWRVPAGFPACNPCQVILRDTSHIQSLASDTAQIIIYPLPTVRAGVDTFLCTGDFMRLQGSGAHGYQWSPATFLSSATVAAPFVSPDISSVFTYLLVGTDLHGCVNTDSVSVEARALPVVNITGNLDLCPGDSTLLTASGGSAYLWSTGAATPSVTLTTAGTYTVTVTKDGCASVVSINVGIGIVNPPFLRMHVKAILQGPYVSAAQLMHDSLRVKNLIPLTEPYSGLTNFTHTGGGGEQIMPAVLAVTGPDAIVDWVFLELRDAANPLLVVATRSALIQRDGDVVDVDGTSSVVFGVVAGPQYFPTVRHRNHLGVQLGQAIPYAACDAATTDFSSFPPEGFYAFNGLNPAQRLVSGKYTLWAGNGRTDFQLKYNGSNNDRTAILSVVGLSTPNAVVPGYNLADYNLDGLVKYNGSANDRNVLLGNVGITTPSAIVNDQIAR